MKYRKQAVQMGEATFHRRRWVLVIIGVPVLVFLVLMSGLVGWFDLNSVHEDVDIATGRIRRTRYLFYCKIRERIEDSIITKALPPDRLTSARPEWHRVNTFCGLNRLSSATCGPMSGPSLFGREERY